MDDAHIRRIKNLSLQLKNQGPEESETICQRQNQLNNKSVSDQGVEGGRAGLEMGRVPPQAARFTHPSVRWKTFHGNLLLYQQRLEAALEVHRLSRELDGVIEQIREKVGSETARALSWEWHCLEFPTTLAHLRSSARSPRSPPGTLMRSIL